MQHPFVIFFPGLNTAANHGFLRCVSRGSEAYISLDLWQVHCSQDGITTFNELVATQQNIWNACPPILPTTTSSLMHTLPAFPQLDDQCFRPGDDHELLWCGGGSEGRGWLCPCQGVTERILPGWRNCRKLYILLDVPATQVHLSPCWHSHPRHLQTYPILAATSHHEKHCKNHDTMATGAV